MIGVPKGKNRCYGQINLKRFHTLSLSWRFTIHSRIVKALRRSRVKTPFKLFTPNFPNLFWQNKQNPSLSAPAKSSFLKQLRLRVGWLIKRSLWNQRMLKRWHILNILFNLKAFQHTNICRYSNAELRPFLSLCVPPTGVLYHLSSINHNVCAWSAIFSVHFCLFVSFYGEKT